MVNAAPNIPVDIPFGTKKLLEKAASGRADKDMLVDAVNAITEIVDDMNGKLKMAREQDPFWFYEPTTGKLTMEGYQLLKDCLKEEDMPVDLDGAMHVHQSDANIKIVGGGNQSGKTTTMTIEDLIKATSQIPFALRGIYPESKLPKKTFNRIRVVCEDYTHGILNHNLPALRKWVPKEFLIDKKWDYSWSEKRQMLTLVNPMTKQPCAEIELMSNQAAVETFQGPPVDRVRYDEEPRKDIYDENLLRFVTSDKLDIGFGMTPTGGLTWVYYDLWADGADRMGNDVATFQLCSVTNPKANMKVLREIVGKISDYEQKKMRLLGTWISLAGLIYGRVFKKRLHVIAPERLGLSKGEYLKCNCPHVQADPKNDPMRAEHKPNCRFLTWMVFSGLDPHTVKATAAVFLALDRNGTHVADLCYRNQRTTAGVKEDLKEARHGYRYAFTKVDPHCDSDNKMLDNRNIFKELKSKPNGIPNLRKADAYKGSILAGVDVIMSLLNIRENDLPELVIIDRPENQLLIKSFMTLERDSWSNEEQKGVKDAILEGKHDHHASLRYILQSKLFWRPYEPLPPVTHDADLQATTELLEAM